MSLTILLLGIGTFVSLLFAVHLFTVRAGNILINRLLGVWFLSRFLDNVLYYCILFDVIVDVPVILKAFAPVFIISPACIFLYVKYFLQDRSRMKLIDWLHFMPVFIGLADAMLWVIAGSSARNQVVASISMSHSYIYNEVAGLLSGRDLFILKNGLSYFYIVLIIIQLYKYGILKRFTNLPVQNIWLLFVTFSIIANQIARGSTTLALYRVETLQSSSAFLLFLSIISLTVVLLILIVLFKNPQLLYGYILLKKDKQPVAALEEQREIQPDREVTTIRKTSLTDNELDAIKLQLVALMESDNAYLDPDLKISYISERLHIPQHHLSYILNFIMNKNFRDWINGYRLTYFIKLHKEKADKMTIEAMALDSGFSNSATFYNAFKKEFGVTPREYFK